ncbi:acyltransferase [Paenibacillus baekrokdamisoli]|uniref:Acyltransferase n=1 Tax=Paenibacillus baekrokdamisoli TaxID=1712516 RepID=A0A3G9JBE8_9BACL|nr:acyltransferase family protein [Paenibacillus baekrokdamisoli]MBB3070817.1 peptidoglycan/LPS O-acetylase OafA/YrhL [Paenibacillus baekrokdamisoli]BBH22243.1 acyltransferase [Paenibacillus baekrokdamisoli]
MPKPLDNSGRYMPGLDGLRAIAVFAVIAYHLNIKGLPGGLLGVGIFFVLSGYLITDILLKQQGRNRRLDLRTFWVRRARRLLPAMFIMIAFVSLWLLMSDAARLFSLKGDIGSALLYISNWWLIFHKVSYFESFGPASPFGHLWSLAVEEQFYLIWPLVLAIALRFIPQRGKLALAIITAAAASAGVMALLYEPGVDPSRVYYGTDTRAFALLIGAALAVVWPSWKLSSALSVRGRLTLDGIATSGLIVVLIMIGKTGEYDSFLYRGGMVLAALATAAVVAAMAHPASILGRIIGSKPIRWFGVRSYGIYLYHYPIIVLTTPTAEAGEFHPWRALIQVILTIIVAELSWRFVEEPIRHGALGRLRSQLLQARNHKPKLGKAAMLLSICVLVISCVSCTNQGSVLRDNAVNASADNGQKLGGTGTADRPDETGTAEKPVIPSTNSGKQTVVGEGSAHTPETGVDNQTKQPETTKPDSTNTSTDKPTNTKPIKPGVEKPTTGLGEGKGSSKGSSEGSSAAAKPPVKNDKGDAFAKDGVTAIGDSVMLDIAENLEKLVPGIVVDGKIGRQLIQATAVIEDLKKNGKLGKTVFIELGTNGSFSTKQLNKLLAAIGDNHRILIANTRVPAKWQDTVNEMLEGTVEKIPAICLIDWYSASEGHKEFFEKDGVHLKKAGAKAYAELVVSALGK